VSRRRLVRYPTRLLFISAHISLEPTFRLEATTQCTPVPICAGHKSCSHRVVRHDIDVRVAYQTTIRKINGPLQSQPENGWSFPLPHSSPNQFGSSFTIRLGIGSLRQLRVPSSAHSSWPWAISGARWVSFPFLEWLSDQRNGPVLH
jgi:hypothetical protein